jgi:hypothetical protein
MVPVKNLSESGISNQKKVALRCLIAALLAIFLSTPARTDSEPKTLEEMGAESPPKNDREELSQRVYDLALRVFENADVVAYKHRHLSASQQIVEEPHGCFQVACDCSGFVSSIVDVVAPRHFRLVERLQPEAPYPQAKTWAKFFSSLQFGSENGWVDIRDYHNLRPGDLIAWSKASDEKPRRMDGRSGHVMIVAERPGPTHRIAVNDHEIQYISVKVIDSSSVYHFPPELLPPRAHQKYRDGLGIGFVRILVSDDGQPEGYWEGSFRGERNRSINGPTASTNVRFARMVPLSAY